MSTQIIQRRTSPSSTKAATSVISNSPPKFAFDPVFRGPRRKDRSSSFTRSIKLKIEQRLIIFAVITILPSLSHNNLLPVNSFPLLPPPSSLQNWWFSKFHPPPPPPLSEKSTENFDEFELIKPRLMILSSSESPQPSYDNVPSINSAFSLSTIYNRNQKVQPSSSSKVESPTKPKKELQTFLLTFFTRDQTAYSAELTEDDGDNINDYLSTTSNPYSENSVVLENELVEEKVQTSKTSKKNVCQIFHGQLVTPSRGYVAASSCPRNLKKPGEAEELVFSATIMLTTGKVLLIRPLISQESSKESRKVPDPKRPSLKAYAIGRRHFTTRIRPKSKTGNSSRSNCYMSEYEKRHISLEIVAAKQTSSLDKSTTPPPPKTSEKEEEIEKLNDSKGLWEKNNRLTFDDDNQTPLKNSQNGDETEFLRGRKLVHQYGRHYLYRVAADSKGNENQGNFFPTILKNHRRNHLQNSNYSSCTERYIETPTKPPPPVPETEPPPQTPPTNNPYSHEDEDEDYHEEIQPKPEDYEDDDVEKEDFDDQIKVQHRSSFSRSKRELSKDDVYSKTFTIETVIFVDRPLLERFNGNRQALQKLILAIMNEVQLIFNFDSLRIRVRILIKAIRFLENGKESPPTAEGDIDQYLDNFCAWQRRLWVGANRTARWDHALMLTGLDLYKRVAPNRKNRKVLGLAWVNGMCRPAYSCTLNEGKNFEAAYVIAHEMAHSLGMLHDGYDNNCDPERYIMSEKTGPGKINWSPCSNLYLENFLTKSNMRCLESTRAEQGGRRPFLDPFDAATDTRLPGEQYSLNEQCELALGKGYKAYTSGKAPFQDVCRELWCSSGTWATPAHPALEGSACSRRKSCYQGGCVDKQRAFAQSKIKMFDNRRPTDSPPGRLSISGGGGGGGSSASNGSSGGGGGASFMRRVQRFLRNTIRSVVGFFG